MDYIGQVLDKRYRLEENIGSGGMAVVYLATDLATGEHVAVKMLKEAYVKDTQAVKRFINESKAISMLNHQNIVKVHSISVSGPCKFIVMEYIDGITLREYLRRKRVLEWRDAAEFVDQVLMALDHAHSIGVVHRDIKPQNIMVLPGGYIKVTDFGIAKIPRAETLTLTDKALGTVYYISPEQASGEKIDARTDIYSLGVMLYELVTGQLPFNSDSQVTVLLKHMSDAPVPPTKLNPRIPLGLEQIILCAMEKNPANRYQSAAQMHRHIRRIKADPTVVFVRQKQAAKTPTSEVTIKKTTQRSDDIGSFLKADVSNMQTITDGELPYRRSPAPSYAARSRGEDPARDDFSMSSSGRRRRNANGRERSAGSSFGIVLAVLAFFAVIAIIGIFFILKSLFSFDISAVSLVPGVMSSSLASFSGALL